MDHNNPQGNGAPPPDHHSSAWNTPPPASPTKFCKYCGQTINLDAVLCTHCGRQVEELKQAAAPAPSVVVHNVNTNTNMNAGVMGRQKDKWVALLLCFFLGAFGAHKFYEGKILLGVVYLFTLGLFGIGALIDFIILLFKPNPYFV